jgi:DNA-binding transcriptional ArsR family regulator
MVVEGGNEPAWRSAPPGGTRAVSRGAVLLLSQRVSNPSPPGNTGGLCRSRRLWFRPRAVKRATDRRVYQHGRACLAFGDNQEQMPSNPWACDPSAALNATRLRLLHALARRPGLSVTALAETLGMKPQAVSNQLQRLVDKGILSNVRNGTNIHYRIIDPCIMSLLDQGLCLTEDIWARRSRTAPRSALPTS